MSPEHDPNVPTTIAESSQADSPAENSSAKSEPHNGSAVASTSSSGGAATAAVRAPEAAALKGLVFDPNVDRSEGNGKLGWWRTPAFFAAAVLVVFAILNILYR